MKLWCERMSEMIEQSAASAAAEAAAREKEEWLHRLTPLQDRLEALLAKIPDEVKKEGLSLPVLQTMLKGSTRGTVAHSGSLGAALRVAGFVRRRQWSQADDGFRSKWYQKTNEGDK